jgi:hypothetical protein
VNKCFANKVVLIVLFAEQDTVWSIRSSGVLYYVTRWLVGI